MFFSGGSDSKLLVWHDATQSEETKRLDEAEQNLLADQQLQNDIRNKRYDKVRTVSVNNITHTPRTHTLYIIDLLILSDINLVKIRSDQRELRSASPFPPTHTHTKHANTPPCPLNPGLEDFCRMQHVKISSLCICWPYCVTRHGDGLRLAGMYRISPFPAPIPLS